MYLMAFVFFIFYILISLFLQNRFVKLILFTTVYKFIQYDSKFANAHIIKFFNYSFCLRLSKILPMILVDYIQVSRNVVGENVRI